MHYPEPVGFSSSNVVEEEGMLYLFGGKTKTRVSNEIWKLDVEKIVQFIESHSKSLNNT